MDKFIENDFGETRLEKFNAFFLKVLMIIMFLLIVLTTILLIKRLYGGI